jgi:hypothetical protein
VSETPETAEASTRQIPDVATVEAMVRAQMAAALGGRRGIVETAIPGIVFTAVWLATKDIQLALILGGSGVAVALLIRLAQRSTVQYVFNAAFSIGLGYLFVRLAANSGGTESEQALAFFAPGILISLGYTVVFVTSILVGWPVIGFMLGSVTGDPTAWHQDKQVVKLCSRLTWVMLIPGAIGAGIQGPIWLMGWSGTLEVDTAVLLIGVLRLGLGWVLRIASWATMIWLLARNATPLEEPAAAVSGETVEG